MTVHPPPSAAGADLLRTAGGQRFSTVLADPPWQFQNRTGKVALEHRRLNRYGTMTLADITARTPLLLRSPKMSPGNSNWPERLFLCFCQRTAQRGRCRISAANDRFGHPKRVFP